MLQGDKLLRGQPAGVVSVCFIKACHHEVFKFGERHLEFRIDWLIRMDGRKCFADLSVVHPAMVFAIHLLEETDYDVAVFLACDFAILIGVEVTEDLRLVSSKSNQRVFRWTVGLTLAGEGAHSKQQHRGKLRDCFHDSLSYLTQKSARQPRAHHM